MAEQYTGKFAHLNSLPHILENDLRVLQVKDVEYGASWKKRGGVGAFMMLARKWDRIEEQVQPRYGYDIFDALHADTRDEGVLDDIRDLRRYLALVEAQFLEDLRENDEAVFGPEEKPAKDEENAEKLRAELEEAREAITQQAQEQAKEKLLRAMAEDPGIHYVNQDPDLANPGSFSNPVEAAVYRSLIAQGWEDAIQHNNPNLSEDQIRYHMKLKPRDRVLIKAKQNNPHLNTFVVEGVHGELLKLRDPRGSVRTQQLHDVLAIRRYEQGDEDPLAPLLQEPEEEQELGSWDEQCYEREDHDNSPEDAEEEHY